MIPILRIVCHCIVSRWISRRGHSLKTQTPERSGKLERLKEINDIRQTDSPRHPCLVRRQIRFLMARLDYEIPARFVNTAGHK
jgi:hypothetical protein